MTPEQQQAHERRLKRAGELGAYYGDLHGKWIAHIIEWASYGIVGYVIAHFIWKYW